jgi:hypothetical protein
MKVHVKTSSSTALTRHPLSCVSLLITEQSKLLPSEAKLLLKSDHTNSILFISINHGNQMPLCLDKNKKEINIYCNKLMRNWVSKRHYSNSFNNHHISFLFLYFRAVMADIFYGRPIDKLQPSDVSLLKFQTHDSTRPAESYFRNIPE